MNKKLSYTDILILLLSYIMIWELRSSGLLRSKYLCVITQKSTVLIYFAAEA
jgi:hypothetical protein